LNTSTSLRFTLRSLLEAKYADALDSDAPASLETRSVMTARGGGGSGLILAGVAAGLVPAGAEA
jgi:hypothetical protein